MKRKTLRGLYSPELLEARIAPATFLVTTLADAGAGSLRAAIDGIGGVGGANDSAGADTITFSPALFLGTLPVVITLTTGEIPISDTITIKGPGIDKLTISGNNTSRIFNIADGNSAVLHPATISGITFVDGNAGAGSSGGAILSRESLSLTNAIVHSSVAGNYGGGLVLDPDGTTAVVTVTGSKFLDNFSGSIAGGLVVFGNNIATIVTIKNSLISGNIALSKGGGLYLNATGPTVTLPGTKVIGNWAPTSPNIFPS